MEHPILELLKERKLLLDGGFGTELIKRGFPQGSCPESWNEEKPDIVKEIHKSYYDAGADAVLTMTFNHHPKGFFTLMGNSVDQFLETMEQEGVPVVGSNCTLNSEEMAEMVKIMREKTSLPIIAQANAGKPSLSEEGEVAYSQGIEDYLRFIPQIIKNGANIIGGCCGTDPDYIARMSEIVKSRLEWKEKYFQISCDVSHPE